MHRALRGLGLVIALLLPQPVQAVTAQEPPVPLFRPGSAVAPDASLSARQSGAARQRLVDIDPGALDEAIAPQGYESAEDRLERAAGKKRPIHLELFPGVSATFDKRAIGKAHGGGYVWRGERQGRAGESTLVVKGGRVTGHVEMDGRVFRIEPVGGASHRVIEIAPSAFAPDAPPLHAPSAGDEAASGAPTAAPDTSATETRTATVVDVLVAYTARADKAPGDILADIDLALALANTGLQNSGIRLVLNLRASARVKGYDESRYGYTTTLYDLSGLKGGGSTQSGRRAFAPVRRLRDSVGADLVLLLREGGFFCGIAWVVEAPSASTSAYGFSTVSRDCIAGHSVIHEIGHNMGLYHDRHVEDPAPASVYNFGFVNVEARVRDIMSYNDACAKFSTTCRRRNLFSNPRKSVSGEPFGVPIGTEGAADASRRLNETRRGIADYRPRRTPIS